MLTLCLDIIYIRGVFIVMMVKIIALPGTTVVKQYWLPPPITSTESERICTALPAFC
jgi:hypothetical protein